MALDLGKQMGPLPLGAWIAVVAGGLGIAAYTRSNAVDTPTIVDDTSTPEDVADGSVGGWTQTQPANDVPNVTISTNDDWGNQAINWLIAQGYDPAWSYSAITKALAGGRGENRLSVREYALWRAALRKWGAPPYPVNVPPPGMLHPPTVKHFPKHEFVPNKPPNGKCKKCGKPRDNKIHDVKKHPQKQPGTFRYAIVKPAPLPGSTLKSLAQIYYHDSSKWHRIFEANRRGTRRADGTPGLIENPNVLHTGWKLIIPQ